MISKNVFPLSAALVLSALISLTAQFALAQGSPDNGATVSTGEKASCAGGQCSPKHHHHKRGGERSEARREAWKQVKSTLTPDQQSQLTALRQEMKSEVAPLHEQMKTIKAQLQADPVAKNADELKTQLKTAHQQLRSDLKANREKMMAILVQRAELKQSFEKGRDGKSSPSTKDASVTQ